MIGRVTDILLGGNIAYAGMLARFATCIGNYANERVTVGSVRQVRVQQSFRNAYPI